MRLVERERKGVTPSLTDQSFLLSMTRDREKEKRTRAAYYQKNKEKINAQRKVLIARRPGFQTFKIHQKWSQNYWKNPDKRAAHRQRDREYYRRPGIKEKRTAYTSKWTHWRKATKPFMHLHTLCEVGSAIYMFYHPNLLLGTKIRADRLRHVATIVEKWNDCDMREAVHFFLKDNAGTRTRKPT